MTEASPHATRRTIGPMGRDALLCVFILLASFALYARTFAFGFIIFDDHDYVADNPEVKCGLTWQGIRWAFTTHETGNWHPLTWLSHMLDVSLVGVSPGFSHGVNACFHALSAGLLFVVLRWSTRRPWLSAFAAAAFAWHPLRVESVAWISERKDVLCTFFWMLTMLAYVSYVRLSRRRVLFYAAALLSLTAGLLCKGMLVTLPFALLLFDAWPLQRRESLRRLIIEKLPMIAIAGAIAVVTFRVQAFSGAVTAIGAIGLLPRMENVACGYFDYLRCAFWPTDLAIFYPNPYFPGGTGIGMGKLIAAALVIIVASAAAFRLRRSKPYLAVGWCWYLSTLVPVIGVVQVGAQSRADRYTYVPSVGLAIAIVWLIAEWSARWRAQRIAASCGLIALIVLAITTVHQTGYWRDTESIMQRAVDAVPNNAFAHTDLGAAFEEQGKLAAAEAEYREALRITPRDAPPNNNLGGLLVSQGRLDEALRFLRQAIESDPNFASAYLLLGDWFDQQNDLPHAVEQYQRGIALEPTRKDGYHHYALALARHGDLQSARAQWKIAIDLDPEFAAALDGYGRTLLLLGETRDAHTILRRAIQRSPNAHATMYMLAWSLATNADPALRDSAEAIRLARRALELSPSNPVYADALAAALASAGRFDEAVDIATRALAATRTTGMTEVAMAVAARLSLYQSGRPFVAPSARLK